MIIIRHATQYNSEMLPFRPWKYFRHINSGRNYPKHDGFIFDNKRHQYLVYWRNMDLQRARRIYFGNAWEVKFW